MDTLTHALSGAVLGRFLARPPAGPAQPRVWQAVATAAFAATFPDFDFVLSFVSDLAWLRGHRGPTHSLILLPMWALLIAWLMPRLLRARQIDWRALYGLACSGIAIHILGDLITQFGTLVLAPLSDRRFGWGTTFIIDLPLTGLLLAGLLASALWRSSRVPAALALVAAVVWVGVGALGRSEAVDAARQYAARQGIAAVAIDAIPRPASPFNWTAVVDDGTRFHIAHLNTRRSEVMSAAADDGFIRRYTAHYRPVAQAEWTVRPRFGEGEARALSQAAWTAPEFAFFRWFSMFPVAEPPTADAPDCAVFRDLRFETPGRDTVPFRYGLCRDGSGWRRVLRTGHGLQPVSD